MPCRPNASAAVQIVEAHGDYVWTAKDNQPEMHEQIALLFQPQQSRPGWSAVPMDLRSATTWNKGHGRLEKRTITVSSLLAGYSDFPYLAQVFRVESWVQLTGAAPGMRSAMGCPSYPLRSPHPNGSWRWCVGNGPSRMACTIAGI